MADVSRQTKAEGLKPKDKIHMGGVVRAERLKRQKLELEGEC